MFCRENYNEDGKKHEATDAHDDKFHGNDDVGGNGDRGDRGDELINDDLNVSDYVEVNIRPDPNQQTGMPYIIFEITSKILIPSNTRGFIGYCICTKESVIINFCGSRDTIS